MRGGEWWRCHLLSASWSPPPILPGSLPADSCTPVIYFSPPHLAGRLLPITQSRGSALTARHPARALASRCDTLCCWTLPTGAPLPDLSGTSTSTAVDQLGCVRVFNHQCWKVICKKLLKSNTCYDDRFQSYLNYPITK